MKHTARLLLTTALIAFTPALALAADEDAYADRLLGDLGGIRPSLDNHGIDLTIEYKGDMWATTQGLQEGGNYHDNLDVQFTVDGSKAFGIEGNTLYLSFLNNFGNGPNAKRVGGVQGIDNIETDPDTFKLYEAYIEQSLFSDTVLALVGMPTLPQTTWQATSSCRPWALCKRLPRPDRMDRRFFQPPALLHA